MTILYNRAVLLAKVESTFGTDATPDASNDAMLVEEPNISYDITQLERNIVRTTLSKLPAQTGRKVASIQFAYEVRNNGNTGATVAPQIGALLRGCSYAQTQLNDANGTIASAFTAGGSNTGSFSYTRTTAYDGAISRIVTLTCTTGGGSGTAEFTVSAPAVSGLAAVSTTGVVMTDATAFTLIDSAQITPTVTTSFDVGDTFTFRLDPKRYEYTPTSDVTNMESLTLYLYLDGLLHKMTGARGTFTVEGTGGEYARFNFDFTGNYVDPVDATMPATPTYETQKPSMVELANLTVDSVNTFAASSFSLDAGNDVVIRDNINNEEAYAGAIITGRSPTASIDPEAELVATHDFFGRMKAGTEMEFEVHVGNTKGNVVQFYGTNVQYRSINYGERNSIRTMDVQMALTTNNSDDELRISFS